MQLHHVQLRKCWNCHTAPHGLVTNAQAMDWNCCCIGLALRASTLGRLSHGIQAIECTDLALVALAMLVLIPLIGVVALMLGMGGMMSGGMMSGGMIGWGILWTLIVAALLVVLIVALVRGVRHV